MKLLELQNLLGKEFKKLTDTNELTAFDIDRANAISKMSRQIINNAQVILRAEKYNDNNRIVR